MNYCESQIRIENDQLERKVIVKLEKLFKSTIVQYLIQLFR